MKISYTICKCIKEFDKSDEVVKGSAHYMNALILFWNPINSETWMTLDSVLRLHLFCCKTFFGKRFMPFLVFDSIRKHGQRKIKIGQ